MLAPEGNRWSFLALFGAVASLTNFLEGYSSSSPNTAGNSFQLFINQSYIKRGEPQGLSEWEFTWFWSLFLNIWFVGYIMGTFMTPFFADTFGRKKTLLVANIVSFSSTIISTTSIVTQFPELLFGGRIIAAAASGVSFGALILFLQETTPTNLRGMASFLSETSYLAMNVVGMGMGMDFVLGKQLVYLVGFGIIPGILGILIMLPLKETPKYLLIHLKDKEAAIKALKYYHGKYSNHDLLLAEMMKESSKGAVDMTLTEAVVEVFKQPALRKAAAVGIVALQLCVGIWPIDYISTDLLEAHFSNSTAQMTSFVFICANFIASLVGMCFIEKFGRRPLLLWCGVANTLCLVGYVVFDRLAFYIDPKYSYGCVGALIAYGITYGAALGPIAFFITGELVPQQFRSLVQSLVFAVNTTTNFVFSFVTLPMYRWIDVWSFIPLFIIPSTFSLIYLYFKMPETRGREIHEIVKSLGAKKPKLSARPRTQTICSTKTLTISDLSNMESNKNSDFSLQLNDVHEDAHHPEDIHKSLPHPRASIGSASGRKFTGDMRLVAILDDLESESSNSEKDKEEV
ncbi:unnamed protein product [Bursaphelenchus okinawaensis]|uniref:Major facilitator superfamily (MFS) profile domain-containing protein n=1 Tax=Bursaphelenchus okinawaensis TaxID=465554 RepID=A0A811K667_9BILA|nr:unnamed protein product [Bursaphelenchus okinawaensis]CAG9092208.1 unnamed protein product [Bursaphelenchus okinawaensis]